MKGIFGIFKINNTGVSISGSIAKINNFGGHYLSCY